MSLYISFKYTNNIYHIVCFTSVHTASVSFFSLATWFQSMFHKHIFFASYCDTTHSVCRHANVSEKHEYNQYELFTKTTFNHRLSCPFHVDWMRSEKKKIRKQLQRQNFTQKGKSQFYDECRKKREILTLQFKRKRNSNEGKDRLQETSITGNKNKRKKSITVSTAQHYDII